MHIQYASDIHLEFFKAVPPIVPKAKVLVLAGDIGYPHTPLYSDFLEDVSKKFEQVFLIVGNHEYYSRGRRYTMKEVEERIAAILTTKALDNVTFLHYSYKDYGGYRFVGLPLWSKITDTYYLINDFRAIHDMTVDLYNDMHTKGREYITDTLANSDIPVILITHHMPSYDLVDPMYKTFEMAPYNQCFASHCDDLIKKPVCAWIYGHTHRPSVKNIHGVQLACNPKGYPGENAVFDDAVIVV